MQDLSLKVADARQAPCFERMWQLEAYSPYGYHCARSAGTLGFAGELNTPVRGCYLLGNGVRLYNSKLMRFSSPDSFSPFDLGGLNPYAYCGGDPINYADRNGHWAIALPTFAKALTAVWGGVAITSPLLKAFKGIVRSSKAWIKDKTAMDPVSRVNRGANASVFWGGAGGLSAKIGEAVLSAGATSASIGKFAVAGVGAGGAMVAGVGKMVLTGKEFYSELKIARGLRLPMGKLIRETVKEAIGINLARGKLPPKLSPRKEKVLLVQATYKDRQALGLG